MLDKHVIDTAVRAVLSRIHDPCSVAAGRPLSLLEMGLVTGWVLQGGVLTITYCVTFAGCTMAPHFTEAAASELAEIPGIDSVETIVDTDFVWTAERMGVVPTMQGTPQAWRTRTDRVSV